MSADGADTLPPGWAQTTIDELMSRNGVFSDGDWVESKDQDANGTVRLIQLADVGDGAFVDKSDRHLTKKKAYELGCTFLKKADLLVARMPDPLGRCCIFPLEGDECFVTVVDVCIIRLSDTTADPKYLMHLLNSPLIRAEISDRQSGSTRKRISRGNLAKISLPIAPLHEQRRIVAKIEELFSELDKGVEALTTARQQLKAYRQAVLNAAVEGSLTNEWRQEHPNTEPASELLKHIVVERRGRWEEEQLRKFGERGREPTQDWKAKYKDPVPPDTTRLPPLPRRWCWASWAQVGFSQNGRPFPSREYQSSGIKLLRPGNLFADGLVKWTDKNTRCLPDHYAKDDADLLVHGRELIINLTAQSLKDDFLGRVCITAQGEKCLLNQRLARLTPVLISPEFMLIVFRSAHFRDFVGRLNTGSLIQHMFTSQLDGDLAFPLPPLEEQRAIVAAVAAQLSVIEHLECDFDAELTNTKTLRQSILRHAFSGKLVSQDPNDEPASVLLGRIKAEQEPARGQRKNVRKRKGEKEAA
jgi:type I restriction enzyme S subunit